MDTTQPAHPGALPVTILVAHGSRNPDAQTAHERLAETLGTATGRDTRPAYLEMTGPTIAGAIDTAAADGATELLVLPCFLHPGNHLLVDLPEILARSAERHRGVHIELGAHLGALPGLVGLLADEVNRCATDPLD